MKVRERERERERDKRKPKKVKKGKKTYCFLCLFDRDFGAMNDEFETQK